MFRRRNKQGLGSQFRNFLWPQSGFRRAGAYILHRVRRLPGSPYSIAAGCACGAAISFTPYMGFHILLGGLLAWLIGGNVLAAAIGTVVGNPWTFPFIWVGVYRLGCVMIGCDAGQALPDELTLTYIFNNTISILLPMSVGAIPAATVVWIIFFWPIRQLVTDYQMLRRRRRE
ncbi:MAG: DUF2062 domain-containing protein [Alphaproteobacteria bacterium]